jgi:hypothetical protein
MAQSFPNIFHRLPQVLLYLYLLTQLAAAFTFLFVVGLFNWEVPTSLWTRFIDVLPFLLATTTCTVLFSLQQAFSCNRPARWLLRISAGVNAALSTWALVSFVHDAPLNSLHDLIPIVVLLANPFILLLVVWPGLHARVFPPRRNPWPDNGAENGADSGIDSGADKPGKADAARQPT